ncbi:hypothetical protein TNCT_675531 [Trichonephila clavata]|uniref:Transposase n=1 Tax=Trichonephila clavata TaxID=2740835 RepID=A0A8X6FXE2_TRICU|nr:hypothetical protein TNCT_675531 [Trichonephila clavata]
MYDNATLHKSQYVWQILRRWEWEELEHPPYSPNVSTCHFDLILKIKEPIRGKQFATRVVNVLRQQVTRFTHGGENAEADGITGPPTACGDCRRGLR